MKARNALRIVAVPMWLFAAVANRDFVLPTVALLLWEIVLELKVISLTMAKSQSGEKA